MIREAAPRDMETLLDWRMEVLDHVFPGRDLSGLRAASRRYYQGQPVSYTHLTLPTNSRV